ncbi:MAG: hypothetical protein ACI89L_001226 [Phycisphaerales bacterium]|jgi:hypothetical protein
MRSSGNGIVAGLAGLALTAGTASATWSIVIVDTRTGEVAAGSATCLTNINLRNETPVIILGRGASTAQALLEQTGVTRSDLRQGLLLGQDPALILNTLASNDTGHQSRQYGLVDTQGRAMTFSGAAASNWKGGVTGRIERGEPGPADDIVYAIQGNILTGEGVVLAAEQAILASPGDVADMLMESMVAARITGGDGRCSCDAGPTDCGTPPGDPADFKSAHVGYMLVGRAGDNDGSRALYRFSDYSTLVGFDLDADGRDELLAFAPSGNTIWTHRYLDASVPGAIAIEPSGELTMPMSGARTTAVGDVTGDGLDDLIVVDGAGGLWVIPASPAGGLDMAGASKVDGVASVNHLALLDLDGLGGLDVVAVRADGVALPVAGGAGSVLTLGAGTFGVSGIAGPLGVGDLDNDGDPDLVAVAMHGLGVQILTNPGDGSIGSGDLISTVGTPIDARIADLDADGAGELIVIEDGSNDVAIYNTDGTSRPGIRAGFNPVSFIEGDVDPGVSGEFVVSSNRRLTVFAPDGAGGLAQSDFEGLGGTLERPAAMDLNGDGLAEVVGGVNDPTTNTLLIVVENQGGRLNDPRGWGAGNYWLALNVPNTVTADPDPVDTMQIHFDTWRALRAGRVDATFSTVDEPETVLAPGQTAEITVRLQAYPGVPITTTPTVFAETTDASVAEVVSAEMIDDQTARVTVRAVAAGEVRVEISADDGPPRPVVLMPSPSVRVVENPADINGDGIVDQADLKAFIRAFIAGDPSADIDGDGIVGHGDVAAFVTMFQEATGRARGRFKH